jgi:hypothetical protein
MGSRLIQDFKFTIKRVPRLKKEKLDMGNRKEIIE